MVDFNALRKEGKKGELDFPITEGEEYPSFKVRGRLRLSEDAADFFKDDEVGVSASNRIRGIVLHDILSKVEKASDLDNAVEYAKISGELTESEAEDAAEHLAKALA